MEMPRRIFRYGPPGRLDNAPFGTECLTTQAKLLYVQLSHDEDTPNWILIGPPTDEKDTEKE